MFDELIETFMQVVKYGSFSKTAEVTYLSPNAIKKRIKSLEEHTGVVLFLRNNKGVTLTKAGSFLYKEFSSIDTQYHNAIEKACRIQNATCDVLCMGMMNSFSDTFIRNRWYEVRKKFHRNPVHIVYYGNTLADMNELFTDVGKNIDACIDIYDPEIAQRYHLMARKISDFRLYIGIPDNMDINVGQTISFEDLKGRTISLLYYGRSRVLDMIHTKIDQECPGISIEEIGDYSIRTFNDCYTKENCILVTENLIELYPFYSFYPFQFEETISFGIYYSEELERQIDEFISKIMPMI